MLTCYLHFAPLRFLAVLNGFISVVKCFFKNFSLLVNIDRDEINIEAETILDTHGNGANGTHTLIGFTQQCDFFIRSGALEPDLMF